MAQPAPQPNQADSMEDILQSIKRIIEDDTTEKPAEGVAAPAVEEDVLDLTQMVKDDGSTESVAALPKPKGKKAAPELPVQDVVQSIDAMFAPAPVAEEEPAAPVAPAPKPVAATSVMEAIAEVPAPAPIPEPLIAVRQTLAKEDGLVSDQATQAAVAALRPIAESAHKDYSIPRIASPELRTGNTVEDLLLEAMRPMLKAWLDEHLPIIVQKIVEKEVKRIVAFHQD